MKQRGYTTVELLVRTHHLHDRDGRNLCCLSVALGFPEPHRFRFIAVIAAGAPNRSNIKLSEAFQSATNCLVARIAVAVQGTPVQNATATGCTRFYSRDSSGNCLVQPVYATSGTTFSNDDKRSHDGCLRHELCRYADFTTVRRPITFDCTNVSYTPTSSTAAQPDRGSWNLQSSIRKMVETPRTTRLFVFATGHKRCEVELSSIFSGSSFVIKSARLLTR